MKYFQFFIIVFIVSCNNGGTVNSQSNSTDSTMEKRVTKKVFSSQPTLNELEGTYTYTRSGDVWYKVKIPKTGNVVEICGALPSNGKWGTSCEIPYTKREVIRDPKDGHKLIIYSFDDSQICDEYFSGSIDLIFDTQKQSLWFHNWAGYGRFPFDETNNLNPWN